METSTASTTATAAAAQADYDSGEDVIEVAFPPASSTTHTHGTNTQGQRARNHGLNHAQLFADLTREAERLRTEGLQREARGAGGLGAGGMFAQGRQPHHHHHHHHHHHRHARGLHRVPVAVTDDDNPRPVAQAGPAVIDLTLEPDSPVRSRSERQSLPQPQQPQSRRHPRRTNSQRISPPSLERSDGNLSIPRTASMSNIIDLTADSPEEEQPPRGAQHFELPMPRQPPFPGGPYIHPRATLHQHPHIAPGHPHHTQRRQSDQIVQVDILQGTRPQAPEMRGFGTDIRGFGRRLAGYLGADIIGINFNPGSRQATGHALFHQEQPRASPKPSLEPTPPTREGFTRDTCAEPEEDNVIICPCCDEELAYDPNDTIVQATPTGASKKRKRAAGEHHFWALKKCGHVYCADCFENRKPTKTNNGVGFPCPPGKTSAVEIRCAVEGCDTKVAAKGEWVGIFL